MSALAEPEGMVTPRRAIVTGNFDGCHLGHNALFSKLKAEAAARKLEPLVVSFSPHTRHLLSPDSELKLLTSEREKRDLLMEHYGLPLVLLPFDHQLRALSGMEFLKRILRDTLGASYWLMGNNHRFGIDARGDFPTLFDFAQSHGVELGMLDVVEAGAEMISSTRIRALIEEGRMREAKELLGYSYPLSGTVGPGARRGRQIGFPTANVAWEHPEKQLPPDGVLAGWATVRGERFPAIANLGGNPTFGLEQRRLEVHLLDWDGDLYGERLVFEIEAWLRGCHLFRSVEELQRQIASDIEQARALFLSL